MFVEMVARVAARPYCQACNVTTNSNMSCCKHRVHNDQMACLYMIGSTSALESLRTKRSSCNGSDKPTGILKADMKVKLYNEGESKQKLDINTPTKQTRADWRLP